MAGMVGLGRQYNIVPIASGVAISLVGCSAVGFYGTNDNTYTLTLATSFAGSYSQPTNWNPVTYYWTESSNGAGTATWTKVTQSASNAVVIATDIGCYFELLTSQVPSGGYNYVKCTASSPGDGTLLAICHDLSVQRTPANLPKVSA